MKKHFLTLLLFFILLFSNASFAQCGDSEVCNSNTGLYSNDIATDIAYDNMGSSFHSTYIREPNSGWRIWGEAMNNDGYGDVLSPTSFTVANYPALTGTIYKMGLGSQGAGGAVQLIVLTSTGLFALGEGGMVINSQITTNSTFQKLTVAGKVDGLPVGVTPQDVKMMFVTKGALIITTCSGFVYVLSEDLMIRANVTSNSLEWSQVMENATTPLSNVVVTRGQSGRAFALKSDGTLWTWGRSTFLGDGNLSADRPYATQMALPAGLPGIKMIQVTSYYGIFSSYYILGTDKKVYSLGSNDYGQLGDRTSIDRLVWVNAKNPDSTDITDAAWISVSEHDNYFPGLAVIKTGGLLYTCGNNSTFMIGRTVNDGVNYLEIPTGVTAGNVITFVEMGGHATALIKQGSPRYGYVGHRVNGSMGDGTSNDQSLSAFNFIIPPIVAVCGALCVPPTITTNGPVCTNGPAIFTISGTAGDIVSYKINNGPVQTITIGPGGSVPVTINNATIDQSIQLTYILGGTGTCSNGLSATASIAINSAPNILPTFTQAPAICQGEALSALPTLSIENIPGTWSPPINNNQTTTYTFTPAPNTCALTTQMTVVVNPKLDPQFSVNSAICYGISGFSLPTVSSNNVNGTWQPAINNIQTTTYTFTPDTGECANTASLEIEVYDDFDFEFKSYCENGHFMLQLVPLADSFDIGAASVNWQYNNASVDGNVVFDVTSYLNATAITETLPISFDATITNANGCDKTKTIVLDNVYCDIQKGISPNGDMRNDFFDLRLLNVSHLSIFNRYGVKVYSKADYYDQWSGQTDDGKMLPDGVYYYVVDFENAPSKTGWIYINKPK